MSSPLWSLVLDFSRILPLKLPTLLPPSRLLPTFPLHLDMGSPFSSSQSLVPPGVVSEVGVGTNFIPAGLHRGLLWLDLQSLVPYPLLQSPPVNPPVLCPVFTTSPVSIFGLRVQHLIICKTNISLLSGLFCSPT